MATKCDYYSNLSHLTIWFSKV